MRLFFTALLLVSLLPVACVRLSDGSDIEGEPIIADPEGDDPGAEPSPPPDVDRFGSGVLQRLVVRDGSDGVEELISQTSAGWTRVLLEGVNDLGGVNEVVISPSGQQAAALVTLGSGEQDIYLTDIDGGGHTRLTTIGMTGISNIRFEQSENPGFIFFNAFKDGELGLYRSNLDGSGPLLLEANVHYGIWYDDDGNLVFRQGKDLYSMNADGQEKTLLSTAGDPNLLPRMPAGGTAKVYSRINLYTLDDILLSNELGTTGDVKTGPNDLQISLPYFAYRREQQSNGRMGLYLVNAGIRGSQAIQVSLPALDEDIERFGFSPDNKFVWMVVGSKLLIHEVGGATRVALDMGADGRIGEVKYSLDSSAIAVGASEDPGIALVLHVLTPDGTASHTVDPASEESGENFDWIARPSTALEEGSYLVHAPRDNLTGDWSFKITRVLERVGLLEVQLWDRVAGLTGEDIADVELKPAFYVPGDDPLASLSFTTRVGNATFAGFGINTNPVVTSLVGRNARVWDVPNVSVAPPKADPDKFSVSLKLGAEYTGVPAYGKNWQLDLYPDGRVENVEWPLKYSRFGKVQFSLGFYFELDDRIEMNDVDFSGSTWVNVPKNAGNQSHREFLESLLEDELQGTSGQYKLNPDPNAPLWDIGLYPFQ